MLLAFVDSPQRHGGLTVFPVVAQDQPELCYLLMPEALRRGVLTFNHVEESRPPCLLVRNRGPDPVLILDCEAMLGLSDSHSTNQSVLLGPDSVTRIPISCRETGKWSCEELEKRFSRDLAIFPILDGQVGVLAFLGRQLLGLDALGTPGLYTPLHRRLLTGYLITALAAGQRARLESSAEGAEVEALAKALEGAHRVLAPCPGHGEYTTIHGEITGGELRHNGHLVHLSVFPKGIVA